MRGSTHRDRGSGRSNSGEWQAEKRKERNVEKREAPQDKGSQIASTSRRGATRARRFERRAGRSKRLRAGEAETETAGEGRMTAGRETAVRDPMGVPVSRAEGV